MEYYLRSCSRFFETMQETLKSTNKTKSLPSGSRCRYKVELNISYARETDKVKSGVQYYAVNYKNDQDSIITAKEWQLLITLFYCSNLFFL